MTTIKHCNNSPPDFWNLGKTSLQISASGHLVLLGPDDPPPLIQSPDRTDSSLVVYIICWDFSALPLPLIWPSSSIPYEFVPLQYANMIITCDNIGWINGKLYEAIMRQKVIPACRLGIVMGGHSDRWRLIIMDARPMRWNARVIYAARATKRHHLNHPSHTTDELQLLDLSLFPVLKSSLNTTCLQPTPFSAKSHRGALVHALLLSLLKALQMQMALSSFRKTGNDDFTPDLVRERCISKYPNYNPIKLVPTAFDHESKPTECQPWSSEAEFLKPDSECTEHCPLIHFPSTIPPVEPSLDERHSNPIPFPLFHPLHTIDPPPP